MDGDGVGDGDGLGEGGSCGVGVGEGEGEGWEVGDVVGFGIGAAEVCIRQVSFLPCLAQIKIELLDFFTCPSFVHFAPALSAAFAWISGMETREIKRSAVRSLWGARTGEVSQGKHRETITWESRIARALVGSPA